MSVTTAELATQKDYHLEQRVREVPDMDNLVQPDGLVRPDYRSTDIIPITPDVDFAYVIRRDDRFVVTPLAERIAGQTGLAEEDVATTLYTEYDVFFAGLADTMLDAFEHKRRNGKIQLHVFDAEGLEQKTLDKCNGPLISADPLKVPAEGVDEVKVSREYLMDGRYATGIINRPGTESLHDQLRAFAERYRGTSPIFGDDDTFTGLTAAQLIAAMRNAGIDVDRAIFDIQMGIPTGLLQNDIDVDAGITYLPTDGRAIGDVSDLGDPRDFLIGASGLVQRLPDGTHGRVPYVLPFVSPAARMGIQPSDEYAFSQEVLALNQRFFRRVGEQLGHELTLGQMDPYFVNYMNNMYGMPTDTPMTEIVAWASNNMSRLRADIEQIGFVQKELHGLNIPRNLVLAEIDDTLLEGASQADLSRFAALADALREESIEIGFSTTKQKDEILAVQDRLHHSYAPTIVNGGTEIHGNHKLYGQSDTEGRLPRTTTKEEAIQLLHALGHSVATIEGRNLKDLNTTLEQFLVGLTA